MVLVTGEAGIGKTRLIEELLQSSQQDAGRVLIGRCYVSEQLLSMGPWVHALRSDARAVRRNLDALHPAYRLELAKLLPELGKSSVPLGAAEVDPLRIFEAVTSLLLCLARRRAVVVVLEDLHWADDLTLRLLAFLLRALRDEPLLVIATARDDEPTWQSNAIVAELMGAPGVRAIRLEPLERATMLALAQTLAGDRVRIDGALEERIWRLSEGNPLVVVETMRMLREADSDVSAADVVMPERMRDLIEQRLQRLDRAGDELVAAAATLGRAVPFPLLQHTTGLSDGAATHALEAVVRQRILHEAGGQVDFVHDRIREVAHDRMLARRRKLLHARAVAAMEDLYAGTLDEHLETVGQHAYEAELWDVAFRYLRRAGLRALARASFRAAGTLLDHARDALSRFPETPENQSAMVDLLFSLRFVGVQAGLRERCAEQLEVAERLARRLGDQRRLGLALAHQSNHVRVHGDHEAAESIGWKALEVAHRCDDIELLVYAPHNLGQMFFSVGQFRRALEFCGQALGVLNEDVARVEAGASPRFGASRGPGATPLLIMRRTTRFWMSKANAALGDFPVAFALATANEEEMNELGAACDALTIVLTTLSLGIPRLACGDVDAAMPILERTLAAARSGGMGAYSIEAASHLGQAYALAGRIDDALAVLERPMEPEFNGNQPPGYPFRLARLAEAYWLAGRTTDASRVAADALHAARKRRERGYEAACLRMLAETATDTSGEACRHFAEAIDVGETLGMAPLVAHCRLGLARVLHRTGDVLHARRQAALAEAHYRRMEMHRWLSEAELLARDGG